VKALISSLIEGDRTALARLLTIVENGGAGTAVTIDALQACPQGSASVIGVTGPPGAGKSTIVDRLVRMARTESDSCAVIAVDSSSPLSGGAILGDRIRLSRENLADEGVFVRSMAARRALGGLADAVPAAVRALEVGGWSWILIETVGVGQSEVDISQAADTTIVVETPESGDEVQANKAGLCEVADIFVVNKADRSGADKMARDLRAMLHSGPRQEWEVPVIPVSATKGSGLEDLWSAIHRHREYLIASGEGNQRRRSRTSAGLRRRMRLELNRSFDQVRKTQTGESILGKLDVGELDPESAARLFAREMAFNFDRSVPPTQLRRTD